MSRLRIAALVGTAAMAVIVPAASSRAVANRTCPVTLPDGKRPPGGTVSAQHYGDDRLWTVLWPHGVVAATKEYVEPDGSVGMKFPWWRGVGVVGKLTISGRRLDAPAKPLRSVVGDGYGTTGFQATGIYFPTEGCWQVTGKAGGARLTFVTIVLKV